MYKQGSDVIVYENIQKEQHKYALDTGQLHLSQKFCQSVNTFWAKSLFWSKQIFRQNIFRWKKNRLESNSCKQKIFGQKH